MLGTLGVALYALGFHSESIKTGQHALTKRLEMEATIQTETGMVSDAIWAVGLAACGRGDFDSGIRLVSFARHVWREDAVAEERFAQTLHARVEQHARAALGDEDYKAAVGAGEALTREQAIELTLGISPQD